jgi:hypothetical protein
MRPTALLVALLLGLAGPPLLAAAEVRFLVTGDAPYEPADRPRLQRMFSAAGDVAFLAHVGDIKTGNSRCVQATYLPVVRLFRDQRLPLVFSPGDNDWTDCRRDAAGGYDPTERLALLRRLFFHDPAVLRLQHLDVRRPPATMALPELFWFRQQSVLFVNWHVVGSYNNRYPRDRSAMAEYRMRRAANQALLRDAMGVLDDVHAVVLFQHANPGLGRATPHPGYQGMHDDLAALLAGSDVPVLLVHGDTHNFQFDQPWLGRPGGEQLWRLEVPGYPRLAGIEVTVDSGAERPFFIRYLTPEDVTP